MKFKEETEEVDHPKHYNFSKYEVRLVLNEWFKTLPLEWQVVKYVSRAAHKGQQLKDLKKARNYLNFRIDELEEEAREKKND